MIEYYTSICGRDADLVDQVAIASLRDSIALAFSSDRVPIARFVGPGSVWQNEPIPGFRDLPSKRQHRRQNHRYENRFHLPLQYHIQEAA